VNITTTKYYNLQNIQIHLIIINITILHLVINICRVLSFYFVNIYRLIDHFPGCSLNLGRSATPTRNLYYISIIYIKIIIYRLLFNLIHYLSVSFTVSLRALFQFNHAIYYNFYCTVNTYLRHNDIQNQLTM